MSKISKIEKKIRERIIEIEKEMIILDEKGKILFNEFESLRKILEVEPAKNLIKTT